MVAATDSGQLPPKLPAGIARAKSPKSMGVRSGNWPTLRQAQAPLNAPDITTAQEARDSAIVAVLLGCALRRSEVAALADGRCSGDRRRLPAQLSASGPAGSPSGRRSRSRTRRTSRPPRACAPAPSSRRAARLRPAPFRTGGAQRWALFGRIHAGGHGRRTACGCVEAVGVVCPTSRPATKCELDGQLTWSGLNGSNPRTPFPANSCSSLRDEPTVLARTTMANHYWGKKAVRCFGSLTPTALFVLDTGSTRAQIISANSCVGQHDRVLLAEGRL